MRSRWKTEGIIAASLLAFGLFVLPNAIFFVGQQIVGIYEGDGALGLNVQLWVALGRADPVAWTLISSPYVVVQLMRLAWRIFRHKKSVNSITVSARER